MDGLELLEPTDLYNILNQGDEYPCISDPNYLLLLDARLKIDYAESHIITAKRAPRNEQGFLVPYDAELECKQHVVVYDSKTRTLKEQSPAIDVGQLMWDKGSRNVVKILKGGYEDFSALYPFLRTQKIIYMPRELDSLKTYPIEIIPGLLYLGNWRQGNAPYIQKDLKVKGHINCCKEPETFFKEEGVFLTHIKVDDDEEADMYSKFETACSFIDEHKEKNYVVLAFSKLGISRSATIVIAYLIYKNKWTLAEAYEHVKRCNQNIRPNRGFVSQLSRWEEDILCEKKTDISDPNF